MAEFVRLQNFSAPEDALEWVDLLKAHHIPYDWEEQTAGFDLTFGLNHPTLRYTLKVRQTDLKDARQIFRAKALENILYYDDSHYLYEFEEGELYEILTQPDQWSLEDGLLAQRILSERGQPVSEEEREALYQKRLKELGAEKRAPVAWIIGMYVFAAVPAILGFVLGFIYATARKTDPEGNRSYTYDAWTRLHGKIAIGVSFLGVLLLYLLFF